MDEVATLLHELDRVPRPLIDDDAAVTVGEIRDALATLDALPDLGATVAVAGPTGAGKSYVLKHLTKSGSFVDGLLRPTTNEIVTADDGEVTYVDTPGWEHADEAAKRAVVSADLTIVIVTPSRYGDAAVASLWNELPAGRKILVLNRMTSSTPEREAIVALVRDRFATTPIIIEEGSGMPDDLVTRVSGWQRSSEVAARRRVIARAAAAGARRVASIVTARAVEVGDVERSIEALQPASSLRLAFPVVDGWEPTRSAIVTLAERMVRDRDDDIVRGVGTDLAGEVHAQLGPWDPAQLVGDLDGWRERCTTLQLDAASVRWRRQGAEQLIRRFAWRRAVNPDVQPPKRFARLTRAQGSAIEATSRDELAIVVYGSIEERRIAWRSAVADIGSFRPGALVAAADALEQAWSSDG